MPGIKSAEKLKAPFNRLECLPAKMLQAKMNTNNFNASYGHFANHTSSVMLCLAH